jgi:arylsulfatase A-like enzyme
MSQPNVVLLTTDQHTYDALGCAGHPIVETPNIDRLAETGIRFERASCPAPTCGPARASLFTGTYPSYHGIEGNHQSFDDEASLALLPDVLRSAGYHTALVGKLHLPPTDGAPGFDYHRRHDAMYSTYDPAEPRSSDYVEWLVEQRFDGDVQTVIDRANADEKTFRAGAFRQFLLGSNWRREAEHSNTWVADESIEYLESHRDPGRPFFLFSSFFGPHQPMAAPGEWADRYDPTDVELPETFDATISDKPLAQKRSNGDGINGQLVRQDWPAERYRAILAAYYGQIAMIDQQIGRILDALDREGLGEDTLVCFTADHGDHDGQFRWFFKGSLYERSIRVPFIVRDPGGPTGETVSGPVTNLSLYPTILAAAGTSPPAACSAPSLWPLEDARDRAGIAYAEHHDEWMVSTTAGKLLTGEEQSGARTHELYPGSEPSETANQWEDPAVDSLQAELRKHLDRCRARATHGKAIDRETECSS